MKNNQEAFDRFEQAYGAKINKLYWIAGSLENSDLKDLLHDDMDDSDFEKCFPAIYHSAHFNDYKDKHELLDALVDFRKFGLLAEVFIPEAECFIYENNKPVSWSIHEETWRIEYVYAETLSKLLLEIEKSAEKIFKEYIKADRKKHKRNRMTNKQSYQSTGKLLLRLILSPFIFLYGCILLIAFTFFPLPMLVLLSIIGIICEPFIWLLRVSGGSRKYRTIFRLSKSK
jgi:hypothetical protein